MMTLALPAAALLFAFPADGRAATASLELRNQADLVQTVAQKKMKATKTTSSKPKSKAKSKSF
jgi:hypothetical protein